MKRRTGAKGQWWGWPLTLLCCVGLIGLVQWWAIRGSDFLIERPSAKDQVGKQYLPMGGDHLFSLRTVGNLRFSIESQDLSCATEAGKSLSISGTESHFSCSPESEVKDEFGSRNGWPEHGEVHFQVIEKNEVLRLGLRGFSFALRSEGITIGIGSEVDFVWEAPGVGVQHISLWPSETCGVEGAEGVCILNGGLGGSVVVDSHPTGSGDGNTEVQRVGVEHGQHQLVTAKDWLWLGHVPLQLIRETENVWSLRLPDEDWKKVAGDRRWMSLETPHYPLGRLESVSKGTDTEVILDPTQHQTFAFYSRKQLFRTPRLGTVSHLRDYRTEYQQEERYQSFIDHELLCFQPAAPSETREHSTFGRFFWNLSTGLGCDGQTVISPPPFDLLQLATVYQTDKAVNAHLDKAIEILGKTPSETGAPNEMLFVFDWAFQLRAPGELPVCREQTTAGTPTDWRCLSSMDFDRVPVRLLGVRPLATRSAPTPTSVLEARNGSVCKKEGGFDSIRPNFFVEKGSTSPILTVENGINVGVDEGVRFVVADWGHGNAAICLSKSLGERDAMKGTFLLDRVRIGSRGQGSKERREVTTVSEEACVLFTRHEGEWSVWRGGGKGEVSYSTPTEETQALGDFQEGTDGRPLINQGLIKLQLNASQLKLRIHAPKALDAASIVDVGEPNSKRRYPFGEDMGPLLGGAVWGGLETTLDSDQLADARQSMEEGVCSSGTPKAVPGVELTIRGDLQRLLFGVLDKKRNELNKENKSDGTAQAVLMDGKTGALLAAVSTPSFDPGDIDEQQYIRRNVRLNGGVWNADDRFQNLAFRRQNQAGSVYKLITSYGMLQAGLLDESAEEGHGIGGTACGKIISYRRSPTEIDPETERTVEGPLIPGKSPDRLVLDKFGAECDYERTKQLYFDLSEASRGFHSAFKRSINGYFALGFAASVPELGIGFGKAPVYSWSESVNPIPDSENGVWKSGQNLLFNFPAEAEPTVLGAILSDPDRNLYLNALLQTGHRFVGGRGSGFRASDRGYQLGDAEAVEYPTAGVSGSRWLPGLNAGAFVYPGIPAWFGVSLSGGGRVQPTPLSLIRTNGEYEQRIFDGKVSTGESNQTWGVETPSMSNVLKNSFGYGGIQASALSLAVMTTPVVHPSQAVAVPHIIKNTLPDPDDETVEPLFERSGVEALQSAMRAVVMSRSGTAFVPFFKKKKFRSKIGGKTGTFHVGGASAMRDRNRGDSDLRTRIRGYACGVRGIEISPKDWRSLVADVETESKGSAKQKALVIDTLKRVDEGVVSLLPGFAGSSSRCDRFNPNRPMIEVDLDPSEVYLSGSEWLETLARLFPLKKVEAETLESSSFVSTALEPLSDAAPQTQGWVLAVLFDDDPDGSAKSSASEIWQALYDYTEIESRRSFDAE